MCDKYINVQTSEFEFVSNHTTESLRILKGDTVLPPNQFQIQPDGSAVYCLKEYVLAELNLDALVIMSTVGTVLSMISVLIVITTFSLFPTLRNLAGKLILSLSPLLF